MSFREIFEEVVWEVRIGSLGSSLTVDVAAALIDAVTVCPVIRWLMGAPLFSPRFHIEAEPTKSGDRGCCWRVDDKAICGSYSVQYDLPAAKKLAPTAHST